MNLRSSVVSVLVHHFHEVLKEVHNLDSLLTLVLGEFSSLLGTGRLGLGRTYWSGLRTGRLTTTKLASILRSGTIVAGRKSLR